MAHPAASYAPPPALYPFRSHWLDRGGQRMHYLDEGPRAAPAVLMLHGNPTWSFYYRNLILALRPQLRCIAPDHIGCGLSDKPPLGSYDYRLASRIADLEALLEHLALDEPLALVAHDWGGLIGLNWAVRHPQRVSRLVLMNTAGFPLPADKHLPPALALARNSALGAWLVLRCNAFARAAARVALKKPVSREVRRAYTGPYDSPAHRIATLRFVQDIPLQAGDPGFDILAQTAEHLQRLAGHPCLIAWGGKDFVFDQPFLREWRRTWPRARVIELADCGHYVLEDGGPELIRAIQEFLAVKDDGSDGKASEPAVE